jgi:hypothetical protein
MDHGVFKGACEAEERRTFGAQTGAFECHFALLDSYDVGVWFKRNAEQSSVRIDEL